MQRIYVSFLVVLLATSLGYSDDPSSDGIGSGTAMVTNSATGSNKMSFVLILTYDPTNPNSKWETIKYAGPNPARLATNIDHDLSDRDIDCDGTGQMDPDIITISVSCHNDVIDFICDRDGTDSVLTNFSYPSDKAKIWCDQSKSIELQGTNDTFDWRSCIGEPRMFWYEAIWPHNNSGSLDGLKPPVQAYEVNMILNTCVLGTYATYLKENLELIPGGYLVLPEQGSSDHYYPLYLNLKNVAGILDTATFNIEKGNDKIEIYRRPVSDYILASPPLDYSGGSSENLSDTLFIKPIALSESEKDIQLKWSFNGEDDIINITVLEAPKLDVDIDSDNNNEFGLPDESPEEEDIENVADKPGKIIPYGAEQLTPVVVKYAGLQPTSQTRMTINVTGVELYRTADGSDIPLSGTYYASDLGYSLTVTRQVFYAKGLNPGSGSIAVAADIYNDGTFEYSQTVKVAVAKVEIQHPKDKAKVGWGNYTDAFRKEYPGPYCYEYQGVVSGQPGDVDRLRINIQGSVEPSSLSYQWTLESGGGTLEPSTTDSLTPTHISPAQADQGELRLALVDAPGIYDTVSLHIFKDHLDRDDTNFLPRKACKPNVELEDTTLAMGVDLVCSSTLQHTYNGKQGLNGSAFWEYLKTEKGWTEVQVTDPDTHELRSELTWSEFKAQNLERGWKLQLRREGSSIPRHWQTVKIAGTGETAVTFAADSVTRVFRHETVDSYFSIRDPDIYIEEDERRVLILKP